MTQTSETTGAARDRYRHLIGQFATGVAVVMAGPPEAPSGMTVNSLTSLSLDPLLLLFCARNESRSAALARAHGRFSVNILAAHQRHLSQLFARPQEEPVTHLVTEHDGWPLLPDCAASFLCTLEACHPGGDHAILVGRVAHMIAPDRAHAPLIFHAGRYAALEPQATHPKPEPQATHP